MKSISLFWMTVVLAGATHAHAAGPACAPWDIGEICFDKKLKSCRDPLRSRVDGIKKNRIPGLFAEKDRLPLLIPVCASEEATEEGRVTVASQQVGESQGKTLAHQSHVDRYVEILTGLQNDHRQFGTLEPLVIEAMPRLLTELRAHLRNNELLLQSHLADLTDELAGESDPVRQRVLRFRIRSIDDMRILKARTSDFSTIDQEIRKSMEPGSLTQDPDGSMISPLNLTLFEAIREGAQNSTDGLSAFQRIESAWMRAEGQLEAALEETRAALTLEQERLPGLLRQKEQAEGRFHVKQSECDQLRRRRDTGVEDDLKTTGKELKKLEDDMQDCKEKYCTTCVSIIGI